MIIENSSLIIKGSAFKKNVARLLTNLATKIQKWGENISNNNKDIVIINPSCSFANAFTLIVTFTITPNSKYQLVMQGDYKTLYKETTETPQISETELFSIIYQNQKDWFKKE
jgi:hypothetical protein